MCLFHWIKPSGFVEKATGDEDGVGLWGNRRRISVLRLNKVVFGLFFSKEAGRCN
jgi:hypothetical protein